MSDNIEEEHSDNPTNIQTKSSAGEIIPSNEP